MTEFMAAADPRIVRLRAQMAEHGLSAMVLSSPQNVLYASGYESTLERWMQVEPMSAVVVSARAEDPLLLCVPEAMVGLLAVSETRGSELRVDRVVPFELLDFCETARAIDPHASPGALETASTAFYAERVLGPSEDDVIAALARALEQFGLIGNVGFDDLRVGQSVAHRVSGVSVVDALNPIMAARIVKTPPEHERFRQLGKLADACIQYAAGLLEHGVSWDEVSYRVAEFMIRNDIRPVDEGAMLFGGSFDDQFIPELFRTPHEGPLQEGQIVILETQGIWKGLWIDINRTAVIGNPTPDFQRLHDQVRGAYEEVVAQVRPGNHTGVLPALGREALTKRGVSAPEKLLVIAHGIGHQPLEFPLPFPNQGREGAKGFTLEEGMVISIDMLHFGSEFGPCHMEDVYIITEDGAELLYATPHELLGLRSR
ncbi:M24 family metallopeptidase [Luminiphilus syltensis]|nr:M24 family metallopeptidase [Luminiphilus syltensis]